MLNKLFWLYFFWGIDFEDDSFEILFEGLQANHTIKRLNICDNFFTEEQSIILANHIMGLHNSITHFGFNLRNTPSYHVKHLTHALEQDTVVESLDWGDSRTLGIEIPLHIWVANNKINLHNFLMTPKVKMLKKLCFLCFPIK